MNSQWNTSDAPKDGSPIVAVGRVIGQRSMDEFGDDPDAACCTVSQPIVAAMAWTKPEGCFEGWHYLGGLSVAETVGDEVYVDFWMPFPGGAQ